MSWFEHRESTSKKKEKDTIRVEIESQEALKQFGGGKMS